VIRSDGGAQITGAGERAQPAAAALTEADLDTPAVVVDLDRVQRNIQRWQRYCDDAGLANRPHIKTHKSVDLARRQVESGAVGITCQKLGEAEVMADGGIEDILIPYNVVGERKLERLAALLERVRLAVSVDDESLLRGLARAARNAGRELAVEVEVDTGLRRAGVQTPDRGAELALAVARTPGLRFLGFLTYPSPPASLGLLAAAAAHARSLGLDVEVVSGGGTPTMWEARTLVPTVTEYRVGTYVYYDRNSVGAGAATLDDVALTVLATVVSRPTLDRAILDAGSKALAMDPTTDGGHGLILEAPRSVIAALSEEHGHVAVGTGDRLALGDRVHVVPNHVCVVSNLFDEVWVARDGRIVERWPVSARGRST
jgi:D-serine deaminase-like pyridoxal phosphate-dependent protein